MKLHSPLTAVHWTKENKVRIIDENEVFFGENERRQFSQEKFFRFPIHHLAPFWGGRSTMWQYNQFSIPLDSDEIFFKGLFLEHPDAHLERPKSITEIHRIVPEGKRLFQMSESDFMPEDTLLEKHFPNFLDVMVLRSARYAPAFKHSHTFFEVVCVVNGSCENHFASQTLHMNTGDICIVSPQTVHALSAFSDECIVYNLLMRSATFEQTFLNSLPQHGILFNFLSRALYAPSSETFLFFRAGEDTLLLSLLEEIVAEFDMRKNYYDVLLNSLLTNFFIKLLRRHEKNVLVPNPTGHKDEQNIIFILRYLTEHYDTIKLKELAHFFNYSERQMTRILKEYTGGSFTHLVQNIRLTKACELLRNPDLSIQDIVDEVGYSNVNHFYQLFKKQYEITPAEYRKKIFNYEKITLPN